MRRPKFGTVLEIVTSEGLAYAQYTHRYDEPPQWGDLIRVLPGLHEVRPDSLGEIVANVERFWVFYANIPFGRRKSSCATIVGEEPVPDRCQTFPTFRQLVIDGNTGRFVVCLWDGTSDLFLEELGPEHESLPRGPTCVNDEALVEVVLRYEGRPPEQFRQWQEQKVAAFQQVGDRYLELKHYVSAVNAYREGLEGLEALEGCPDLPLVRGKLAYAYEQRAKAASERGDSVAAAADRRKARALRKRQ